VANNTMRDLITKVQSEGNKSRDTTEVAIRGIGVEFDGFSTVLESIYAEMKKHTGLMQQTVYQLRYTSAAIDELIEDFTRMLEFQSLNTQASPAKGGSQASKTGATTTNNDDAGMDIGNLLGLSAVAIGALAGAFRGWIKAIDFFSFGRFTKWVATIEAKFMSMGSSIVKVFTSGLDLVKSGVMQGLGKLASLLKFDSPAMMKVFAKISKFGSYIVAPFIEAGKMLGSLFNIGQKIAGSVGFIGKAFGSFGTILKFTSKIVSKLFPPLLIIMTIFDTIKGMIDGFATGGILGGLKGAITGFFNSLIFGPLDLIKDMTAWVLDMLGFDKAAEFLNSFSFSGIFTMIVDGYFNLITSIANGIMEQFMLVGEGLSNAWDWISETWSSTTTAMKNKFSDIADYIGSVPDRMWLYAQEMWVGISTRLKKGFILFGDWFASIPARIKYMALSTIREYDPTGYLVSEEAVAEAKSAVDNRSSDTQEKIAQVDREAVTQMQSINEQKAKLLGISATQSSGVNVAPQTNIVNGGNDTKVNTSSTTIINAAPHQSLNAFMPI
jgi:hypothetical protein